MVKANGKKINFYGTGWDYGGLINAYNNGKFEKSNIFFFLDAMPDASPKVMGDRELNTDMKIIIEREIIILKFLIINYTAEVF